MRGVGALLSSWLGSRSSARRNALPKLCESVAGSRCHASAPPGRSHDSASTSRGEHGDVARRPSAATCCRPTRDVDARADGDWLSLDAAAGALLHRGDRCQRRLQLVVAQLHLRAKDVLSFVAQRVHPNVSSISCAACQRHVGSARPCESKRRGITRPRQAHTLQTILDERDEG